MGDTEIKLGEDYCLTYNILSLVFPLLKPPDLLRCSEVCKLWKQIAMDPIFWRSVTLEGCKLNFEIMSNVLEDLETTHVKLKDCLFVLNNTDMFNALKKMASLRKLELSECSSKLVKKLSEANPNLEVIKANIICGIIGLKLDLNFVMEMPNIIELRLYCNRELDSSINCLQSLRRLKHLYLLGVKQLWLLNLKDCNLGQSTQLQSLGLGDCWNLARNFGDEFLKTLTTLKKLRLEACKNCHIAYILESISQLKELKDLELIEINVENGFEQSLGLCTNIKKLTIVPNPTRLKMALFNSKIYAGVTTLKHSLKQFIWGFIPIYLEYTQKIAGHKNYVPLLPWNSELYCESQEFIFLSLNNLQNLISEKMTQTKVIVECKEYTGNVFLSETL